MLNSFSFVKMSGLTHINYSSFGNSSAQANMLVIEISDVVISFVEFNSIENKALFVFHYPIEKHLTQPLSEQLINALKHFQISAKTYASVLVNYFTAQFTLCPFAFYNADNNRSLLEFNVGNVNEKIILTDDINHDIKLIYAIDENLKSILDKLFPQHQIKHILTVQSKLMLTSDENSKENILLSVNENRIDLVVKQEQKLLLANQYTAKSNEDILYYILFVLEQYNLNPLTANISVSGNIDVTNELIHTLKKYVKNIRLVRGHKNINWTVVTGAPQHYNYTLINRLFCE